MINISTKGTYGLAALFELALNHNQGSIQIKEIAIRQKIPQHYLEQLLVILKKAGFVESERGAQGGYYLKKDPSRIKIIDVLDCLEGKINLVEKPGKSQTLKIFWKNCQEKIEKIFKYTLKDLLDDNQKLEKNFVYHI